MTYPIYCIHCAIKGRGHSRTNTPCQDKTAILQRNGVSTIALADGAGSAKFSHFGADKAVKHITFLLAEKFAYYFSSDELESKQSILDTLRNTLKKLANSKNCQLHDLASTLLCVAKKGNKIIILHIGDGVIGALRNNKLELISSPDNGEFANITTFITSKNALVSMRFLRFTDTDINGFVLLSDGASVSLYDKQQQQLAPVLKNIIRSPMHPKILQKALHNSFENVIKQKTTDDCSIALMYEFRKDSDLLKYIERLGFSSDILRKKIYRF